MPLKIFAPGAYRWENKGDAALVLAFLDWVREDFDASAVELTSFSPSGDSRRYDVPVYSMLIRPLHPLNRILEILRTRFPRFSQQVTRVRFAQVDRYSRRIPLWITQERRGGIPRLLVPKRVRKLISSIRASDLVISVPGGYLLAPKQSDDWWLSHIPTFELAAQLGKSIVLGPCSLGPFHEVHKERARRLLALPQVIMVREDRSRELSLELGIDPNRLLPSPDLAFAHNPQALSALGKQSMNDFEIFRNHKPTVGVSVRAHHFPGYSNPKQMFEKYLNSVSDALLAIQSESDASICVFSQTEEDLPISLLLMERLRAKGACAKLFPTALSPSDLQRLYGQLDMLIGTRMHANILALCQGTPVVGIAYEPKTLGILESLGLGNWGIWIHDVGDGNLLKLSLAQWRTSTSNRNIAALAVEGKRRELKAAALEVIRRLDQAQGLLI